MLRNNHPDCQTCLLTLQLPVMGGKSPESDCAGHGQARRICLNTHLKNWNRTLANALNLHQQHMLLTLLYQNHGVHGLAWGVIDTKLLRKDWNGPSASYNVLAESPLRKITHCDSSQTISISMRCFKKQPVQWVQWPPNLIRSQALEQLHDCDLIHPIDPIQNVWFVARFLPLRLDAQGPISAAGQQHFLLPGCVELSAASTRHEGKRDAFRCARTVDLLSSRKS